MNLVKGFGLKSLVRNFMNICPVGADLFDADGRTNRHDEANSRSSQLFCESAIQSTPKSLTPLYADVLSKL